MKLGLRCSLGSGRSVQSRPTRHIFKDIRKTTTEEVSKEELKKIVENKPTVDKLIDKVGKVKLKPKVLEELKKNEEKAKEYVKKLRKKPKQKINFEF